MLEPLPFFLMAIALIKKCQGDEGADSKARRLSWSGRSSDMVCLVARYIRMSLKF